MRRISRNGISTIRITISKISSVNKGSSNTLKSIQVCTGLSVKSLISNRGVSMGMSYILGGHESQDQKFWMEVFKVWTYWETHASIATHALECNVWGCSTAMTNQGWGSESRASVQGGRVLRLQRMNMGLLYRVGECLTTWIASSNNPQHSSSSSGRSLANKSHIVYSLIYWNVITCQLLRDENSASKVFHFLLSFKLTCFWITAHQHAVLELESFFIGIWKFELKFL